MSQATHNENFITASGVQQKYRNNKHVMEITKPQMTHNTSPANSK